MSKLMERVKEVEQLLQNTFEAGIKLKASGVYSATQAQQMVNRMSADAKAEAQRMADEITKAAAVAVEVALKNYRSAYAQAQAEMASPAAAMAMTRAQTLGATVRDIAPITDAVNRAITSNDQAMLMALHDVALPMIISRSTSMTEGPMPKVALNGLMRQIETAQAMDGDRSVIDAEMALSDAQNEQASVQAALESVNFRQGMRNGGNGPLKLGGGSFFSVSEAAGAIPSDAMRSFKQGLMRVN